ncbi:endonuclease domain-containing protein [Bacillus sp. EB600]|uniref:endonuclease domain-containing protein n=1 Tax=Bacillus sp. EB600 TaxID=2806345 RepID=UPI00210C2FDC|nr:DUF559 domain-containing protein [Bacillus sp. EB600]MCQ6282130.1 DUF559 domain-containing protein [Bacillus sp. EB600]
MIDYILFFALLAVALLAYIFFPKVKPVPFNPRNKCESPIERRLYDALAFRGYAVSTQVPCGKYRIDLALMGPRIAIECDGKAYHSSPEQKAHDKKKNAYLKRNGWQVMRFSGSQITSDLGKVLQRIEEKI